MQGSRHDRLRGGGNRPPRSRIGLLATEERFVLETPPRGWHWAAVGQLVGGFLVLVICAQWTGRELSTTGRGSAVVSLPFWLLGLAVILGALQSMLKHHRVDL